MLREEGQVESIVRRRVWGVLAERCGDDLVTTTPPLPPPPTTAGADRSGREGWEIALDKWREKNGVQDREEGRGGWR